MWIQILAGIGGILGGLLILTLIEIIKYYLCKRE
jgi:hypothetical protein